MLLMLFSAREAFLRFAPYALMPRQRNADMKIISLFAFYISLFSCLRHCCML